MDEIDSKALADRIPIAATEDRDVDYVDVTGWGVFKYHAIPVSVARFIAEKINLYHEHRPSKLAALEDENKTLREVAMDATAHLVGAASAYRKYAKRHKSVGKAEADPMFTTRANDFDKAAKRCQAAVASPNWPKSDHTQPLYATPPAPRPLEGAVKARAGEAYLEDGADHTTYDIDVAYTDFLGKEQWWGGQIKVFGDEKLRDRILSSISPAPQPVGEVRKPDWPALVQLGRTLGFFASAIKSGEPWSGVCQSEYDKANAAIKEVWDQLSASPSPAAQEDGI